MGISFNAMIFGALSFAAGAVSLAVAVYLSPFWKNRSAGKLILLMVSVAAWALPYSMEFFTTDISLILWWVKLEYFGAAWVGLMVLNFILAVVQKPAAWTNRLITVLGIVPVVTILLVLTNDFHHLIWRSARLDTAGAIPMMVWTRGPVFWGFVAFSYGMLLIATVILVRALSKARGLLKKQLVSILAGIAFPWLANVFYLDLISARALPDLTPIAFTLSGFAFAWGLLRYQMLNLIPLAHATMIESMGDPVIALDSEDRILDVNRAARDTLGLVIDVPGQQDLSQAHPALYRELAALRSNGEAEIRLEQPQGAAWWDMRIFPLCKPKDRACGWIVILRDITDRKKDQAALVESERIHRTMLQAAPNPIVLYDPDGNVTHVNPAFTRVFGWEPEEILGQHIDFIPENSREATRSALKKVLEEQKIYNFITQRLTRSGKTIDVSINSALCQADDGRPGSMVVNYTDITHIIEAEKALRSTKNYIRSIINSMPSMLIGLDERGIVTHWNQEAARLTGIPDQDAEGRPLQQIFPQLSGCIGPLAPLVSAPDTRKDTRISLTFPQGHLVTDITVYPVASDAMKGVVVRVDDVGDRLRMEELMVQSEKMLSVGGLAAGMAHEINNPLAGIIQSVQVIQNRLTKPLAGNIQAAEECGLDLDCLRDYLDKRQILSMMALVNESGQRAAQIVANMLSFSRKSGRRKACHYLHTILDDTIELIRSDFRMKRKYDFKSIDIIRDYESHLPPVTCEKGEIQQVFLNILKNGAEAMVDAGTPAPCFVLRCYKDGGQVKVEIRDNGPGMDRQIRKRIFEPFFTTKDVGLGTGLGLSVSYFIITENHNGTLEVKSEPGQGAAFTVSLPSGTVLP